MSFVPYPVHDIPDGISDRVIEIITDFYGEEYISWIYKIISLLYIGWCNLVGFTDLTKLMSHLSELFDIIAAQSTSMDGKTKNVYFKQCQLTILVNVSVIQCFNNVIRLADEIDR